MTRYLRRGGPRHDGRLRMFCFPYAGGGASAYAGWQRWLGTGIEVLPVQLPGREGRMTEPRFTDLPALVADLDRELGEELDHPHVLFGHSMGALIAFALAQHRRARGERLPLALLLGAHRAPHLPAPPLTHGYVADDAELMRGLAALGGLPRVLLDRPEWLAALLPVVRGDLMLCEGAGSVDRTPLPVPLHTFAGAEDRLVTVPEVREWSLYSTEDSETVVVPGGHFYIREQESAFLDRLSEALSRYTDFADLLGMDLVGASTD
ncbi:alpha/beta fold hydrolase [Streptomyces sp. VNUA24]|uniref:thioesterase II family protein n=1 Tax=Streptomyces sp. VNUA24 TaxID=3031131 RepID=UPI0023B7C447|nr:alpha/beta fold hydrolase [Streptomyces sp. VNUA24]WEH18219.1 alpha/beta fold hydrolase [Streptomyces sp. VNUA24]